MVDIDDKIMLLAASCKSNYLYHFMEIDRLVGIKKDGDHYKAVFEDEDIDVTCFFELVEHLRRLPIYS